MNYKIKNQVFARAQKYTLEENVQNGYAKWGKYDDLPKKYLRVATDAIDENGLSEGSTWHTSCIEGIVKHMIADGLALESGGELPAQINSFGETPNELFEKLAYDFKVLRRFAVEVVFTPGSVVEGIEGLQIEELYHISAASVRDQERNDRGYIENHFVSKHFGATRNAIRNPVEDERAEMIPAFNPNKVQENTSTGRPAQIKQLLVVSVPSRIGGYYPDPDYKGGMTDVFTDSFLRKTRISIMNTNTITSGVWQIAGLGNDEKKEQEFMDSLDNKVEDFTDRGIPIVLSKPVGDAHIIGAPISVADVTETDSDFDDDLRSRIFSSHGVTSARILGIKEDNQGFSTEQIMEEFLVFTTLTIRPIQMRMLSGLNKLAPYLTGSDFVINPIQLAEAIDEDTPVDDIEDQETDTNEPIL